MNKRQNGIKRCMAMWEIKSKAKIDWTKKIATVYSLIFQPNNQTNLIYINLKEDKICLEKKLAIMRSLWW